MGLVKGQAKRDAVGQPFTNVKETRPYPPEVVADVFVQPPPAPEGRGGMLAPPFKGGRSPWGEVGGGVLIIYCLRI